MAAEQSHKNRARRNRSVGNYLEKTEKRKHLLLYCERYIETWWTCTFLNQILSSFTNLFFEKTLFLFIYLFSWIQLWEQSPSLANFCTWSTTPKFPKFRAITNFWEITQILFFCAEKCCISLFHWRYAREKFRIYLKTLLLHGFVVSVFSDSKHLLIETFSKECLLGRKFWGFYKGFCVENFWVFFQRAYCRKSSSVNPLEKISRFSVVNKYFGKKKLVFLNSRFFFFFF